MNNMKFLNVRPKNQIITRMAPSPTGELHIGGLRTLLFNYALAKKNNGVFILRIEDTDQKRLVAGATSRILEVLKEYGLEYDEGPEKEGDFGPYIQSERLNIYREFVDKLLASGHAYYCFCSQDRISKLRSEANSQNIPFKYDRYCMDLAENVINEKINEGSIFTVRLKVPDNEDISFNDEILGKITINSNEIDDQVLLKSDGFPTYHMAVVVDDYLMRVSHVLRGVEWLPSTPKQVLLYRYLEWEAPKFAHLPNLKRVGSNKKLSKREGDVHAIDFLRIGYLPEAVLNFIMFLGWNPKTEKEIYSLEEFVNDFDISGLQKTDLVSFNTEKLDWYNKEYLKKLSSDDLNKRITYWSRRFNQPCLLDELNGSYSQNNVLEILNLVKERMITFSDFNGLIDYFLNEPNYDKYLVSKYSNNPKKVLEFFLIILGEVEFYNLKDMDSYVHMRVKESNLPMKEYFMTLRIAITGETVSPPIIDIIYLLGVGNSKKRIKNCLDFIESSL
jgi:glutamyl-tRNA synthetase